MFGKLHLLLLHFPIGLLSVAFLLALLDRWRPRPEWPVAGRLAVSTGAATAVLTAICGWQLAGQGGYDERLLNQHFWLGVATAALAVLAWVLRFQTRWQVWLLGLCTVVLSAAGHVGGSLTHGENYLFENEAVAAGPQELVLPSDSTVVYDALIQPILQKKCSGCHNAGKIKGGLRLDSADWVAKGGENGPVVSPGKTDDSRLLQRALLPLHAEEHMPPAGKPQLTPDEIELLRWWITNGADFKKNWAATPRTPEIERLFAGKSAGPANPVFALPVAAAAPSDLARLRSAGANVTPLGAGSPWLAVSWTGNRQLTPENLLALRQVGEQVVDLNLSNTNVTDALLADLLPELPHLTRLHLAQTATGDAGILGLKNAQYLDFLNISNTQVGDASAAILQQLPRLQALYLWGSGVSAAALQTLQQARPNLRLNTGAATDTSAAPLPLRPPKVLSVRQIFDDTVHVTLDFPRLVEVHYTLDGASPTTQSLRYEGPIVLNQTGQVRAKAFKPGWADSPEATGQFLRRSHRWADIRVAQPPSPKYTAKGAASLGDGVISDFPTDNTYLGYEGQHFQATLDLGTARPLSKVHLHTIESFGAWVHTPRRVQVWTSTDGQNWTEQASTPEYPVPADGPQKALWLDVPFRRSVEARFVKVRAENWMKNPPKHPQAGKTCWVFVDEIMAE